METKLHHQPDVDRMRMSRDELALQIARHVADDSSVEAAPGLFLYRFSSPTGPRYGVTEPSFCVIRPGKQGGTPRQGAVPL